MNHLSLFSGIGAFEKALDKLSIPYELVAYCEIDKYASKSYAAIHGVSEEKNLGDITKVDEKQLPKDIDLLTYGFPCQDISIAGAQKGLFNADGTQTRSGLFFEALRIIEETKPRVAIAENVKNLTSKKFAGQFKLVLDSLEAAGYNNYWQVMNAKDFGVPQNRGRVFIVSIRKDVDNGTFKFPEGFPLDLWLNDVLEDDVDEKFYISTNGLQHTEHNGDVYKCTTRGSDIASTIRATIYKQGERNLIQNVQNGRGYEGVMEFAKDSVPEKQSFVNGDVSKTIRVGGRGSTDRHSWDVVKCEKTSRFRKYTPRECFRLMGFDDADYEKAASVNSNTQLYKQAGNSIVVAVPKYIIAQLLECGALTK